MPMVTSCCVRCLSMPIRCSTDLTQIAPLHTDCSAKVATTIVGTTSRYAPHLLRAGHRHAHCARSQDLSQLGRPIAETIIIDNSPASYIFHPHNAVPISSWFNDQHDTELTDLFPFLADLGSASGDVRGILNVSLDSVS